jgi:hypothetical protein
MWTGQGGPVVRQAHMLDVRSGGPMSRLPSLDANVTTFQWSSECHDFPI